MSKLGLASCVAALLLTACSESTTTTDTTRYGTWLWNGSNWTQLAHLSGTEAKSAQGFPGGETLNYWKDFGGLVDTDGTRWDGTAWVVNGSAYASPPGTTPGERIVLVFDEARDQVLFLDPSAATIWAWSHETWKTVVSPTQWPKARYLRGVAYDPMHREVLILTCCNVSGSGPVRGPETSVWNGQALVERPGLPDDGYDLVSDGKGHMLAFGTRSGFSWDGESWSALAGHPALPDGGAVRAIRDVARDQIVAFGQNDNGVSVWRWKDGRWQPVATASSPPGGCDVSNPIYDPELSGIVITDLWADCKISVLP